MSEKSSDYWGHRLAGWWRENGIFVVEKIAFLLSGGLFTYALRVTLRKIGSPQGLQLGLWILWWLLVLVLFGVTIWAVILVRSRRKTLSDLEGRIQTLEESVQRKEEAIEGLKEEKDELRAELGGFLETYLRTLAVSLGFDEDEQHTERITLYSYDPGEERFVNHERYSFNEELKRKNRLVYPKDTGCIGEAWKHGDIFEQFPDPDAREEEYLEKSGQFDLTPDEVEEIRMKSQLYYGWKVRSLDGRYGVAVIMVESLDRNRWEEEYLRNFFSDKEREIREYVNQFADRLPQPAIASQKGF